MISLKSHLLLVFILSFLAIHIPLLLSTVNEYLEVCNPYFDGCFSISRSSRQPISIFVFKPLMIISALGLFFLWPRLLKKNYKRILEGKIYVYPRANQQKFDAKLKNHHSVIFSDAPIMKISSSEIRSIIRKQEDYLKLVPSKIHNYISKNNLYR